MLPFGGAFKGISAVVAGSRAADHAANVGLIDSIAGLIGDPTALGYFAPKDGEQVAKFALGGPLMVAFENAWNTGSGKDEAAKQEK